MEDAVPQGRRPRGRGKQRPCDFCRVRKIACILQSQPPCLKCEKSGRRCTFEKDPPPRAPGGRSQSGYEVDGHGGLSLEQLQVPLGYDWAVPSFWPELSGSFDAMHDVYTPIEITSAVEPAESSNRSNNGSVFLPDEHTNRRMPFEYTEDRLRQNTPGLSTPLSSRRLESTYSSRYLGPTSETDPILRQRYQYDEAGYRVSKFRGFRDLDPAAEIPSVMLLTPAQVSKELADCVALQPSSPIVEALSEYGEILISLFHRFIEPYYPVLRFSNLKPDDKCKSLLAMVYSMALPWRSFDPNLPWVQFNAKPMTRAQLPDQDAMHRFAWSEICREMHAPDYSTISACLLLMERKRSHIFVADSSFDTCLVATTKSLAFSLGLHRDCETWNMDLEEKSTRRLLWCLIYVQDIWVCTAHGQPPNIKSDDFDAPLLSYNRPSGESPTYESTAGNKDISVLFLHLLELTQILDDIHQSLFAIRNAKRLSENLHATSETIQSLKTRLLDWKTSFDHLSYLEAAKDPDDVFGLGSLLVAYQYCQVLIHRTALRVFKGNDQYDSHYEEALQFVQRMLADFSAMKPASFDSFWFSWSRAHFNAICDFVVLLGATSRTAANRARAEELMSKYRHWLWMRSKSFEVVRMSLVRLDSIKGEFCAT